MERIGPYLIEGELGRGGLGTVYRTRHPSGQPVALKILHSTSEHQRQRFLREVAALQRLDHPHVVRVLDAGQDQGRLYLAMELISGGSLQRRLDRVGTLASAEAADLVCKLALALEQAHRRDILHRDIKPENVLIDMAGQPRLVDFGLAKDLGSDQALTRSGTFLGTPGYWAPEQALGRLDRIGPATDVYLLGATLYATLTGGPPFRAESLAGHVDKVSGEPPVPPSRLNPSVDDRLGRICLRCLAKDPAERYPSAGALAEELGGYLAGPPVEPRRAYRRAAALLGVLAVGAAGVLLVSRTPSASTTSSRADPVAPDSPIPAPSASDPSRDDEALDTAWEEGRRAFDERRVEDGWAALKRIEAAAPDGIRALELRAGLLFLEQSYEEVVETLDAAIAHSPKIARFHLTRATALMMLERDSEALATYARLLAFEPDHPDALLGHAGLLEEHDPEAALYDLDRLALVSTDLERVHSKRARLLQRLNRPNQALEAYGLVIRANPDSVFGWLDRAKLRHRLGDREGALADLIECTARGPRFAEAWFLRGKVHLALGDPRAAADAMTIAIQHGGPRRRSEMLTVRSSALTARGDLEGAIEDLRSALELEPRNASFWGGLGQALLRQQAFDEAEAAFAKGLEHDPQDAAIWSMRGHCRHQRGDAPGALADYGRALELKPNDGVTRYNRGLLRQLQGELGGAREDLRLAVELLPADHPSLPSARALLEALERGQ